MAEPLLSLQEVRAGYGEGVILDRVSLELPEHGSLAILGRNGMGKTTLLLTIMGHTRFHSGLMRLRGEQFQSAAPHRRPALGLGWVPQERDIFASLSVEENLLISERAGYWNKKRVFEIFPRLAERRRNLGNRLSGGEQQMLAIGRALMSNPSVLLLDEPLEGLAPIIIEELVETIRHLIENGIGIMLVEQQVRTTLELADQAIILEGGQVAYAGSSRDLTARPELIERYIGL